MHAFYFLLLYRCAPEPFFNSLTLLHFLARYRHLHTNWQCIFSLGGLLQQGLVRVEGVCGMKK